jgi:CubicO group peptidase (beta-lactamase class C family)
LPATPHIDERFAKVRVLLENAIAEHAFPAASLGVLHRGKTVLELACGTHTYDPASTRVTPDSIFDIASVSKVVATTTMAMLLYERGQLSMDAPVASVLPEFASGDQVTFRMLLAHSSGLPAYLRLFEPAKSREELLKLAFATQLVAGPLTVAAYSDIGFILLGVALERLAGEPLNSFCAREVFAPLDMASTMFCPPKSLRDRIIPTVDDRAFRHKVIQGEVHDENAWVMGGVAGHAGVFSTASDLLTFSTLMLRGGAPLVRRDTLALFTQRQPEPPGTSRALGWDTPSQPSQSGKYFSARSFGHLGYTGTSLWIDPDRDLAVAFLTNRVWPDCNSEAIKAVRPALHDAIIEALPE